MKKCYECGKTYCLKSLKDKYGENSNLVAMGCCSKQCFSARIDRAKSIRHIKFDRIKGLEGKNGIIDVMKIAKYTFVSPSQNEIAVVLEYTKNKKMKGFMVNYQSGKNADGSYDSSNLGLYRGYDFESTIEEFNQWEKLTLVDSITKITGTIA